MNIMNCSTNCMTDWNKIGLEDKHIHAFWNEECETPEDVELTYMYEPDTIENIDKSKYFYNMNIYSSFENVNKKLYNIHKDKDVPEVLKSHGVVVYKITLDFKYTDRPEFEDLVKWIPIERKIHTKSVSNDEQNSDSDHPENVPDEFSEKSDEEFGELTGKNLTIKQFDLINISENYTITNLIQYFDKSFEKNIFNVLPNLNKIELRFDTFISDEFQYIMKFEQELDTKNEQESILNI